MSRIFDQTSTVLNLSHNLGTLNAKDSDFIYVTRYAFQSAMHRSMIAVAAVCDASRILDEFFYLCVCDRTGEYEEEWCARNNAIVLRDFSWLDDRDWSRVALRFSRHKSAETSWSVFRDAPAINHEVSQKYNLRLSIFNRLPDILLQNLRRMPRKEMHFYMP